MVRASKNQARAAARRLGLDVPSEDLYKRRTELVSKCWPRNGEPWSGGENKALRKAVRAAIGPKAKLPRSLSARALGMGRPRFIKWCMKLGRTPEAIQARWHMLMFCTCADLVRERAK